MSEYIRMEGLTWDVYTWTSSWYQLLHLHTVDRPQSNPQRLKISGTIWHKLHNVYMTDKCLTALTANMYNILAAVGVSPFY